MVNGTHLGTAAARYEDYYTTATTATAICNLLLSVTAISIVAKKRG